MIFRKIQSAWKIWVNFFFYNYYNFQKCFVSVRNMKAEFSTPKDLEKLKEELRCKVGSGIDPNHPDMGPIMDSLIMTSMFKLYTDITKNY